MNMNINEMLPYVTYLLVAIGVMAFLVSVITQVIKELPGLKEIPTGRELNTAANSRRR